jgi:hypothetical protein
MKTNFVFFLFVLPIVTIVACTAQFEGGSGAFPGAKLPNGGFMDSKATIAGPSLNGRWLSRCNAQNDDLYRVWKISVQGENITRQESLFSDSLCTRSVKVRTSEGRFRFIEKYDDGSYAIEYAFKIQGGTEFPQEKILVDGNKLLISDRVVGADAALLTNEPLFQEGIAPRPPVPPAQTQAIIARDYAHARYAFCSTQGLGVLLDFQGARLDIDGTGTARVAGKVCGDTSELKWQKRQVTFTVTIARGAPQIKFPGSEYDDSINPSSYQSGLATGQAANTLIGGNSGECYFLENAATKKIPFIYACE